MADLQTIDGSLGEGGGQVLRSSLALSIVTGKPFRIENIRAGRNKPGLLRQHLTAVRAAAEVGRAEIKGDALGSTTLEFTPTAEIADVAGDYRFAIGSAGSTTLVVQTILPPLLCARGRSTVTVEGGTHNSNAPPFEFVERTLFPLLERTGPRLQATLHRHGFYPAGGGKLSVSVEPSGELRGFDLLERGEVRSRRATAIVANLARNIAKRELAIARTELGIDKDATSIVNARDSDGPGNALLLTLESKHVTEVVTAFGERGVRTEQVARNAVAELRRLDDAGVPVGEHLADQLLVPLALAGGGSFRTLPPTPHTMTNLDVIRRFLDVDARVDLDDATGTAVVTLTG